MIAPALQRVAAGQKLSRAEMRGVILAMVGGEADDLVIGALLAALRARGETLDEVVGAATNHSPKPSKAQEQVRRFHHVGFARCQC